jgi:hypothetical protein
MRVLDEDVLHLGDLVGDRRTWIADDEAEADWKWLKRRGVEGKPDQRARFGAG